MAAPTVFASAVSNPGGTDNTLTVTLSTHAVDDILLIFVANTGNALWGGNPAGWNRLDQRSVGNAGNGVIGTWLWRKVVSGDTLPLADPVCTLGATSTRAAVCRTIRGADLEGAFTLPEWGARGFATGTGNPVSPPTLTTIAPEMLVLHCYGQRAATDAPEPTGYTQDQEIIISGTLVLNASQRTVADQQTTLSNQDASPTSGARWVVGLLCIPSSDYVYYRSSEQALTAAGTSATPALPTGTSASDNRGNKDLIIATIECDGTPTIAPNTPADWTQIAGEWATTTSGDGTTVRKYWAHYDGTLDRQFNRSTSGEIFVSLSTYRNTHQTSPIGAIEAQQNASATTSTFPALVRTATKATIQATCVADDTPTYTPPTGWIERNDSNGVTCADQVFNATGTTTSDSFTLSPASPTACGLIEILSVSAAAPVTVTPDTASLTTTPFAPSITFVTRVTPTTAALTGTGFAPTLFEVTTPTAASLNTAAFAPVAQLVTNVIPSTASLTLTRTAPSLLASVVPTTGSLSITTFAPTITLTENLIVIPTTATLTATRFAPSLAPLIVFLDPGGDAVQAIGYFSTAGANPGNISFDTTVKVAGVGSYKFDSGANLTTYLTVSNCLGASRRISFSFRFDATHTAQRRIIHTFGVVTAFRLALSATSTLQILDASGSIIATGSTVLLVDTFYRIGIAFTGSPDNLDVKVFIDGLEELSTHVDDTNSELPLHFSYGWTTASGTNKLCWFDQIYIDTGDNLTDPGDVFVTAKLPATVNNNGFDTTGGTGAVNERPPSETDYKQHADITTVNQDYTIQSVSAGDIDISSNNVRGYMGWVWAKQSEAGGSHSLILNGTNQPITLTTSPAFHRSSITSTSYPSNAAGIGLTSSGTAADTFLYETGVVIAFTEGAGQTLTPSTASLTLVSFSPSLSTTLTPGTGNLSTSNFAPALSEAVTVANTSLTITIFAPSVTIAAQVIPGTASLTTAQFAPTLRTDLTPVTTPLTLAAFAPSIRLALVPDPSALTITRFAPQVALSTAITPNTSALAVTTFAPNLTTVTTVTPGTSVLSTISFAPQLSLRVTPSTQTLSTATFAPIVEIQSGLIPGTATLTTTTFAASTEIAITPSPSALTLSAFEPTVQTGVIPGTTALTMTGFVPALADQLNLQSTSLMLATFAPTITVQSGTVMPDSLLLVTTGFAPTVPVSSVPSAESIHVVIRQSAFASPKITRGEFALIRTRNVTFQ